MKNKRLNIVVITISISLVIVIGAIVFFVLDIIPRSFKDAPSVIQKITPPFYDSNGDLSTVGVELLGFDAETNRVALMVKKTREFFIYDMDIQAALTQPVSMPKPGWAIWTGIISGDSLFLYDNDSGAFGMLGPIRTPEPVLFRYDLIEKKFHEFILPSVGLYTLGIKGGNLYVSRGDIVYKWNKAAGEFLPSKEISKNDITNSARIVSIADVEKFQVYKDARDINDSIDTYYSLNFLGIIRKYNPVMFSWGETDNFDQSRDLSIGTLPEKYRVFFMKYPNVREIIFFSDYGYTTEQFFTKNKVFVKYTFDMTSAPPEVYRRPQYFIIDLKDLAS